MLWKKRQRAFKKRYSLSLIFSGLLQQLYNWADALIVGNINRELALAVIVCLRVGISLCAMAIMGFSLCIIKIVGYRWSEKNLDSAQRILFSFNGYKLSSFMDKKELREGTKLALPITI